MKRITALLGTVCVVALFSCKKDVVTPVSDFSQSQKNLAVTTVNGKSVNTDTIPPTNAVDVKTYGATGNGTTDDTKALQNAINAQSVVLLSKGTYVINQTLNMRAGVKIYGVNGASIKGGSSISGSLSTSGRYFMLNAAHKAQIINVTFLPANVAFKLGTWSNAIIYLENTQYACVQYCRFNFNQPYQALGVEGIWVDGPGSLANCAYKNTLNTVGIEYEEYGAVGTIVNQNTINNAHSNALAGNGNGGIYCSGAQIINNVVNNAGCNGINDWGTINGSLIRGNVITGTGKSPTEGALGEGIQAVGVNTIVSMNIITDAQAEYIECGFSDKLIDSNTINDKNFVAMGIVVNTVSATHEAMATRTMATLNHNVITGCQNAIELYGAYSPSCLVENNHIYNPKNVAIFVNSSAASYNLTISGNLITMNTPSLGRRSAIESWAVPLTKTQLVTLSGNTMIYTTGANGGAGLETAIQTCTNNATLNGNTVTGNGVKSKSGTEVTAMDNAGVTYTGYSFVNNNFTGCLYWLSGFLTSGSVSGNNFTL